MPYPDSDETAPAEAVASWLVLVLSGVPEAGRAAALSRSDGPSRLSPSVVVSLAPVLSTVGLAHAVRELPVGTAYAVRIGTALC